MIAKCLSVQQPWADEIASGLKTEEYRDWQTKYRGPLAIVASKVPVIHGSDRYGEVVCVVDVVGMGKLPDGGWAWELANVRPVEAGCWPVKGRMGLYGKKVPKCCEELFAPQPTDRERADG
jgi:hypothetical protein